MAFQFHQNKIYESLRNMLDIQPKCDYNIDITTYHHPTKSGLYMGVTARLMTYFLGTIYLTEDRRKFLGMKAQAIHNRTVSIGPLEPSAPHEPERGILNNSGHYMLLLTDNGVTNSMKLAWNNSEHDPHTASNTIFNFLNKEAQ